MVFTRRHAAAAGHMSRRLIVCAAMLAIGTAVFASGEPAASEKRIGDAGPVSVVETDGIYRVTATFTVPQVPAAAIAVLTDFERIPSYVPDMKTSTIIERNATGPVVEQEAVARFMMFTKKVHLLLQVSEDRGTITFRDRCGKSFDLYEGAWIVQAAAAGSTITYQLAAKPLFDVPPFVLKRLMKRDAADLVASITAAIAARGVK